jgi:hypothetical protein
MFLWIIIFIFIWIFLPIHNHVDGFKGKAKKLGKTISKGISKTANQVGGAIAKIATAGLGPDAQMVLKNMRVIKKSIGGFIQKGDDYVSSPLLPKIPLVTRKCGI